jgi:hypothetical protein
VGMVSTVNFCLSCLDRPWSIGCHCLSEIGSRFFKHNVCSIWWRNTWEFLIWQWPWMLSSLFDAILIFKLYQLLAFPSKDQSVPCGMTELPHFVVAGSQLLVTGIRMNRNRTWKLNMMSNREEQKFRTK